MRWNPKDQRDANGKTAGTAREVFGCHFVNPKSYGSDKSAYFSSVVIFSSNSGFTQTPPQ